MAATHGSTSSTSIVGNHYRVGRKIGEGSFGVIFEGTSLTTACSPWQTSNPFRPGTNLLNSMTVAIKFVSGLHCAMSYLLRFVEL